jgi:hypothetical protein
MKPNAWLRYLGNFDVAGLQIEGGGNGENVRGAVILLVSINRNRQEIVHEPVENPQLKQLFQVDQHQGFKETHLALSLVEFPETLLLMRKSSAMLGISANANSPIPARQHAKVNVLRGFG